MRARLWLLAAIAACGMASVASANDELMKLEKDANQWVMPTGNYANQRARVFRDWNKQTQPTSKKC